MLSQWNANCEMQIVEKMLASYMQVPYNMNRIKAVIQYGFGLDNGFLDHHRREGFPAISNI